MASHDRAVNAANMRAYRDRKRASGYCTYGGCWRARAIEMFCEAHQIQYNARQRGWRKRSTGLHAQGVRST